MSTSMLAICSVIERRPVGDNVSLVCALTAVIRLVIRKSFDMPLSAAATKWCSRPEEAAQPFSAVGCFRLIAAATL